MMTRPDVSKAVKTVFFGRPTVEYTQARENMSQGKTSGVEASRRVLSQFSAMRAVDCHPMEQFFQLALRQMMMLARCRAMNEANRKEDIRQRKCMRLSVLEHFPCPDEYRTPLQFVDLQELLQTHQNFQRTILPQWTVRYVNEKKRFPLEGRFMKEDSFAQEVKTSYGTFMNVPWTIIAKAFLKNLDTPKTSGTAIIQNQRMDIDQCFMETAGDQRRRESLRWRTSMNLHWPWPI